MCYEFICRYFVINYTLISEALCINVMPMSLFYFVLAKQKTQIDIRDVDELEE